jgi:hypothetical protein
MYRCTVESYVELVGTNRSYVRWWEAHPEAHPRT